MGLSRELLSLGKGKLPSLGRIGPPTAGKAPSGYPDDQKGRHGEGVHRELHRLGEFVVPGESEKGWKSNHRGERRRHGRG